MLITVDVKAGANIDSVEETGENRYMVHVKAPPTKGKANKAIIKLLTCCSKLSMKKDTPISC